MKKKLFLITENDVPKAAFIEESFTKAKLYFYGYIYGEKAVKYKLREIGTFDNKKLITNNIFICGGYETEAEFKNEKSFTQQKLTFERNKNKSMFNAIKEMFNGEEI